MPRPSARGLNISFVYGYLMKTTGIDAATVLKVLLALAVLWVVFQVVFFVLGLIGELVKLLVLTLILAVLVLVAYRLIRGVWR